MKFFYARAITRDNLYDQDILLIHSELQQSLFRDHCSRQQASLVFVDLGEEVNSTIGDLSTWAEIR